MYKLIAYGSDGYDWSSELTVMLFEDKDVADLVCEEMNALSNSKCRKSELSNSWDFYVREIKTSKAQSEKRVAGIVHEILADNGWKNK